MAENTSFESAGRLRGFFRVQLVDEDGRTIMVSDGVSDHRMDPGTSGYLLLEPPPSVLLEKVETLSTDAHGNLRVGSLSEEE